MKKGRLVFFLGFLLIYVVWLTSPAFAQAAGKLPSLEDKTAGMRKIDGFLPLYWDESSGKLWMEISRFDQEILNLSGIAAGLGSNDIGLDRGAGTGNRVVKFERVGPTVLMVEPNWRFRASSDNREERRAVEDAFARSVAWGFTVAAESEGRVLVELNPYLLRDSEDFAPRLRPGNYRLDASRSAVYLPMTMGFPKNTEKVCESIFPTSG